ncbi:MAG: glycosyltransferase family 2 protein [Clostridium sp.]|nr:MAG: glycosyltransferase family 2 protein [Clostridium sp.]
MGFFMRGKKFEKAPMDKKYACVISARNESQVIGNLIDSIKRQSYPSELVTIFVVADNCTDNTAEICRNLGAIVYERFDKNHVSKGYALEFLFDQIEKDYGILSNDYYLIFDADNLLKKRILLSK